MPQISTYDTAHICTTAAARTRVLTLVRARPSAYRPTSQATTSRSRVCPNDSSHPVEGGSANDYDYCAGDPINCDDLGGTAIAGKNVGPNQAWFCLFNWKRCLTALNSLRSRAEGATGQFGDMNGWSGGQRNAFRHAYWMAIISKRYGSGWAVGLGEAHEADTPKQYRQDSEIDKGNNDFGAYFGQLHKNWSDARIAEELAGIVSRRERDLNYSGLG